MAMIDSNKLYRRIAGHSQYSGDAILTAISCLAEGKEIHDVPWLKNYVEVVRCKDCEYYSKSGFCRNGNITSNCDCDLEKEPNSYCDWGKRRGDK